MNGKTASVDKYIVRLVKKPDAITRQSVNVSMGVSMGVNVSVVVHLGVGVGVSLSIGVIKGLDVDVV